MHAKISCGGFPLDLKMINRHFKTFTSHTAMVHKRGEAQKVPSYSIHIKTMSSQVRWRQLGRKSSLSSRLLPAKIPAAAATGLFSIKSFKIFSLQGRILLHLCLPVSAHNFSALAMPKVQGKTIKCKLVMTHYRGSQQTTYLLSLRSHK